MKRDNEYRTNNDSGRRQFLKTTAAGGAMLGLGNLGFLSSLPAVSAAETKLKSGDVHLGDDVAPIVKLLEETPRDRLLEEVASRIQRGTSYREVLAGLLTAGVRNVQPRPSVGFKFHAVLVVNSAHLASLSGPDEDRWLPIFWALDYYKSKQLEEERASGWKLKPVNESNLPPARKAHEAFTRAMDQWDVEAADAAVASLARNAGANEVFETLFRYGARDFRSIGHKAIFVANSMRALSSVGWRHSEPVLRSLSYALLNHSGDANPAESDQPADRPWRRNTELAAKIQDDWQAGRKDDEAVREMLAVLRDGSNDDACDKALALLNKGVAPQSVWDAVLVGAGELLMRQPGIIGLHSLTTANALLYAYRTSRNDDTRRMMLLQACAFVPMFRESARGRGRLKDVTIDDLKPPESLPESRTAAVEQIFAEMSRDRMKSAAAMRAYLPNHGGAKDLIDAARRLIFLKGNDAHDYKFSSAVLEDYYHVSDNWRDVYLPLSAFNLTGSGERDNALVRRTRQALAARGD